MEELQQTECPDCGNRMEHAADCQELTCRCGAVLISEERELADQLLAEEISRKWYYSVNKQKYGPVPWNRIKALISAQKLGADDLIWSRGMQRWKTVRQFQELIDCFPEGQRPALKKDEEDDETARFEAGDAAAPSPRETSTAPGALTGTYIVQISAGLLTALGLALICGIAVVLYAALAGDMNSYMATWLAAAFIAGAVLSIGASKLIRLLCDAMQEIHDIREQLTKSDAARM